MVKVKNLPRISLLFITWVVTADLSIKCLLLLLGHIQWGYFGISDEFIMHLFVDIFKIFIKKRLVQMHIVMQTLEEGRNNSTERKQGGERTDKK